MSDVVAGAAAPAGLQRSKFTNGENRVMAAETSRSWAGVQVFVFAGSELPLRLPKTCLLYFDPECNHLLHYLPSREQTNETGAARLQ
jgi:hypothetical protein